MNYEFSVYQMNVEGHLFWVAESKALKGCIGQGETAKEAIQELSVNETEWLETAEQFGTPIPLKMIRKEKQYSGKVSLRFSPFVHEEAADNAKELGISLNQYINDAIVNYNAICRTQSSQAIPQDSPVSESPAAFIDITERLRKKL